MYSHIIKKSLASLMCVVLGCQLAFSEKELYTPDTTPKIISQNTVNKLDDNADKMVQLDIMTEVPSLSFTGSFVKEAIETRKGYTLFLLDGIKEMEMSAPGYLPVKINFNPVLKGGNHYRMDVATRETQGELIFSWIDDQRNTVYIDDLFVGTTPFQQKVASGPHKLTVKENGSPVYEGQVVIEKDGVLNLGVLSPDVTKDVMIQVNTDPNALVLIDSKPPVISGAGDRNYKATSGTHDIIAIQPFRFTNGSRNYNDTLGTVKRRNFKSKNNSIDLPLAGTLTLHKASTTFPNLRTTIEPKKGDYTYNNGTMIPANRYVGIEQDIYPLLGEYELFFTADGYKDKSTTIFIRPGDESTYTIKLDRAKPYYFVMYNASINNYLGLEIAGCGKYFGWYGRVAGLGAYDTYDLDTESSYYGSSSSEKNKTNLSFTAGTGPMFTILRTRTWWYLQLGGGYMRKFYNKEMKEDEHPMSGWMAEAAIVARIPFGLALKVGYSYPFYKDKTYSMDIQNIQISIGAAF